MNTLDVRINEVVELLPLFAEENSKTFLALADVIIQSLEMGGKILICGNGGSAADSNHLAAEFVNAFSKNLSRRALPAISLVSDMSVITAISNDFDFRNIFSRQVEALGRAKDVLILFSTSGESENCISAVNSAKNLGITTVAFTKSNSPLQLACDFSIVVPSTNTQHIQECHIIAYHSLVEYVEEKMFGSING